MTFVVVEERGKAPMVPLTVLADPARRAALSMMLLLGAVVAGYVYFTSLYLQDVLGFSPLQTGLALIPATGTVMVTATVITRRVLPRFGVRKLLLVGLSIVGLGQLWLFTISNTGSYQLNVLGGIMLTAFGMGLAFPTASVAVTSGVGAGRTRTGRRPLRHRTTSRSGHRPRRTGHHRRRSNQRQPRLARKRLQGVVSRGDRDRRRGRSHRRHPNEDSHRDQGGHRNINGGR